MSTLRDRLRAALPVALKQRDALLVGVLRNTLAALDNAEAVPVPEGKQGSLAIEATPVGVGVREAPRRSLSPDTIEQLVRDQIRERYAFAQRCDEAGRPQQAELLRREGDALAQFLE